MRAPLYDAAVTVVIVSTLFAPAVPQRSLMQALPTLWKETLLRFHAKVNNRPGAGGHHDAKDLWSPEEDASIFEQRHGRVKPVSWKKISVGERSADAIRNRHRKHLVPNVVEKTVPWDEASPCMAVTNDEDYDVLSERLRATGTQLPLHVRNGLLSMHATREERMHAWSLEENACILAAQIDGKTPSDVQIDGRTPRALRNHWLRLRRTVPGMLCRFHRAVSNTDAPLLQLQYDAWTPIAPESSQCQRMRRSTGCAA